MTPRTNLGLCWRSLTSSQVIPGEGCSTVSRIARRRCPSTTQVPGTLSRFCKRYAYGVTSHLRDHASWEVIPPPAVELACSLAKDEATVAIARDSTVLWCSPSRPLHEPRRLKLTQAKGPGEPKNGVPDYVRDAAHRCQPASRSLTS